MFHIRLFSKLHLHNLDYLDFFVFIQRFDENEVSRLLYLSNALLVVKIHGLYAL